MRPFSRSSRDLSFFVELQCDEVGLSLAFRRDFDGSVTFGVESGQDYLLNKSSKKSTAVQLTFKVRNPILYLSTISENTNELLGNERLFSRP